MEYRQLGRSGLQVSEIGLGANNFGQQDRPPFHIRAPGAEAIINQALDVGINFIDTANSYARGLSEEFIGQALKGKRPPGGYSHEGLVPRWRRAEPRGQLPETYY